MNNLNSIILEGNLTRDPVIDTTPKGTSVCHFTVASNRFYKSDGERQEEVGFFDVEVWSRLAETCGEYLEKGRGVRVVGRLKQDRWTNPEGEPRSRIRIVGEHVEFRTRPKTNILDKVEDGAEAKTEDASVEAEAVPAY
ncbi:MAG: single-stranded DNA-binding protein [Spirochaetaceae bacterium]|nr:single-stranded DNA-binding protein [Spirochaetaceae bacterium]MDT8298585.1 single-stranded DNA-binding protein [Spirochaetaceae bacterium]